MDDLNDNQEQAERKTDTPKARRAKGTGGVFAVDGVYYISYRANGKTIKESSRSTKPADAERLLRKRLTEIEEGELAASPLRVKIANLLDDLISDYKIRELSSLHTITCHIEGKEYGLRKLFGHMKPRAVTKAGLTKAVERWKELKLKPATINKHLATLRRAFTLGVENRKIGKGAVPDFPSLSENNARQTYVGPADVDRLIRELPADVDDLVDWLHGSSQRWGEAVMMEWSMFHHDTWTMRIPGSLTKNELPREFPIVHHLRPIIERRLAARRLDCPYIFHRNGKPLGDNWVPDFWQPACVRARLGTGKREGGFTPHDLRHIAATDMRRAGIPESIILKIGGWETAAMFRRYAITDTQELADNLGKLAEYRAAARQQPAKIVPIRARAEGEN